MTRDNLIDPCSHLGNTNQLLIRCEKMFLKTTQHFQRGDRLYTSILTYKDGPRTERIKILKMVVNPQHRYSNESERAKYGTVMISQ